MITFCNTFCRQFCRREPETALQLSVSSMAGTFTKTFSFIFAFIHGIPEIRLFSSSRPVPDWLRAYDHNEVMKHKWLAAGQSSRLALGFILMGTQTHLSNNAQSDLHVALVCVGPVEKKFKMQDSKKAKNARN